MSDLAKVPAMKADGCDHGISFPEKGTDLFTLAMKRDAHEVRKQWPRLHGKCPKGCGYEGIAYASYAHYIAGDW